MIKTISKKAGFVLAIAGASVVGGAATALVSAAIPNNDGVVRGCYRNSASLTAAKGSLRVVDTEACANGETAINWQTGTGSYLKDLKDANLSRADLRYRDMSGVDLSGANLSGSSLGHTVLKNANLQSTVFDGAEIYQQDFSGINLSSTDLRGASIIESNLKNTNINTPKDFSRATIAATDATGVNFKGGVYDQFSFDRQNLSSVDVSNSNFGEFVTLSNIDQSSGARFSNSTFGCLRLITVTLENVNFENSRFNCFGGNSILDVKIKNSNFNNVEFKNENFQSIDFSGSSFVGATWDNVTCSDGTNSNNNGNTCIGHLQ